MPYAKKIIGDETEFHVQPNKAPSVLLLVYLLAGFIMLFGLCLPMIAIPLGIVVIVIGHSQHAGKNTKFRYPTKFTVSKTGIIKSGRTFLKDDIHRIIIRNHNDSNYEYIPNLDIRASNASAQIGIDGYLKRQQKIIAVSYRTDIESGGTPTTLACGLTEPEAYAILSDVSKILEFKIN